MKKIKRWSPELKCKRRDKENDPEPCYADVKSKVFMPKSEREELWARERQEREKQQQQQQQKQQQQQGSSSVHVTETDEQKNNSSLGVKDDALDADGGPAAPAPLKKRKCGDNNSKE
mmetsp:Transcript_23149/g.40946  ORF Transcript_23149/g.40946 Transcript_23149/m.40946 type:complete len:117 (+) Transcript_23149:73-423(+)